MHQARTEVLEQFEDDLIQRVHTAAQTLQAADLPLTQNNICDTMGFSRQSLPCYRRAKAVVDQIAIAYHQAQGTIWGSRHRRQP